LINEEINVDVRRIFSLIDTFVSTFLVSLDSIAIDRREIYATNAPMHDAFSEIGERHLPMRT
jgi:hypothetical protein